jgi:signal transduction histidine kinase
MHKQNDDVRIHLLDASSNTLFSNLLISEKDKIESLSLSSNQIVKSGNSRVAKINTDYCSLYVISSNENYVKSSQKFKTLVSTYEASLESLYTTYMQMQETSNRNTSRLLHNVVSLNAHNIQEFFSLIPQSELMKQQQQRQIIFVENKIKNNLREVAKILLRMAKNNAAIKSEFTVFNKLIAKQQNLRIDEHNVHKVIRTVIDMFFLDLIEKEIRVNFISYSDETYGYFDFECVRVALYHILQNTVKYALNKTDLNIHLQEDHSKENILIRFEMTSLRVLENERERIFEENYSGDLAHRTGKKGGGLGLYISRQVLKLTKGELQFYPSIMCQNPKGKKMLQDEFEENNFVIILPKKSTQN